MSYVYMCSQNSALRDRAFGKETENTPFNTEVALNSSN